MCGAGIKCGATAFVPGEHFLQRRHPQPLPSFCRDSISAFSHANIKSRPNSSPPPMPILWSLCLLLSFCCESLISVCKSRLDSLTSRLFHLCHTDFFPEYAVFEDTPTFNFQHVVVCIFPNAPTSRAAVCSVPLQSVSKSKKSWATQRRGS